jgi:hypothetical protein
MEGIKDIVKNLRQMLMSDRVHIQSFLTEIQKLMDATRSSKRKIYIIYLTKYYNPK